MSQRNDAIRRRLGDHQTPGQYELIVKSIYNHVQVTDGQMTTIREIVAKTGLSFYVVTSRLRELRALGIVDYRDGKSRTIRLVSQSDYYRVPSWQEVEGLLSPPIRRRL